MARPYAELRALGRVRGEPRFGDGRTASAIFLLEVLTELGDGDDKHFYGPILRVKVFGGSAEDLEDDKLKEGDVVECVLRVDRDKRVVRDGKEWVGLKDEEGQQVFDSVYIADDGFGSVKILDETLEEVARPEREDGDRDGERGRDRGEGRGRRDGDAKGGRDRSSDRGRDGDRGSDRGGDRGGERTRGGERGRGGERAGTRSSGGSSGGSGRRSESRGSSRS